MKHACSGMKNEKKHHKSPHIGVSVSTPALSISETD
jgi:hypothetical protein